MRITDDTEGRNELNKPEMQKAKNFISDSMVGIEICSLLLELGRG